MCRFSNAWSILTTNLVDLGSQFGDANIAVLLDNYGEAKYALEALPGSLGPLGEFDSTLVLPIFFFLIDVRSSSIIYCMSFLVYSRSSTEL